MNVMNEYHEMYEYHIVEYHIHYNELMLCNGTSHNK